MIVGYLYQYADGSFHEVRIRAALNKYLKDAEDVMGHEELIVAKWTVKKRSKK